MVNSQAFLFVIFLVNGLIIGFLFDFFRILRRSFKTGIIITSLEDIIFWLITGIIILYSIFIFNNGILRGYMFLGILIGVMLYMITLSSILITINVAIIKFIKKILNFIALCIIIPVKTIIRPIIKILNKIINIITKKDINDKKDKIKEGF